MSYLRLQAVNTFNKKAQHYGFSLMLTNPVKGTFSIHPLLSRVHVIDAYRAMKKEYQGNVTRDVKEEIMRQCIVLHYTEHNAAGKALLSSGQKWIAEIPDARKTNIWSIQVDGESGLWCRLLMEQKNCLMQQQPVDVRIGLLKYGEIK